MQSLVDKESKSSFSFPGLQDTSIPRASKIVPEPEMKSAVVKKVKDTVPGTKKLVINKPKY